MPPLTAGAHCAGVGCDHAPDWADGGDAAPPRPPRRPHSRRAGRNDERRIARRALLEAALLRRG